jgi:hypothetical protein
VIRGNRGRLARKEVREIVGNKASREILALRGFKENRGFKVLRGFQGKRVRPEVLALKGTPAILAPPEQKATLERLVLLVPKETPEKPAHRESRVFKASRAKLVRKGFKARLEVPVPPVSRVFREKPEPLVRRETRVIREPKGIRATRGQKAIRAILA